MLETDSLSPYSSGVAWLEGVWKRRCFTSDLPRHGTVDTATSSLKLTAS